MIVFQGIEKGFYVSCFI